MGIKAKVEAKNGLESFCSQMKNTLTDEKLKDKFTDDDKKLIEEQANKGLQFVSSNPDASTEEFDQMKKDIEAAYNPIMQRIYQAAGGAGMGGMGGMGGMPGAGGPTPNAPQPDDDLD